MSFMKRRGFTLVEFIIYIGLASFFIVASLNFVWMLLSGGIKQGQLTEVNDSGVFILQKISYSVQRADGLNDQSIFNVHPGRLVLDASGGQIVFDTYQKNITLGSEVVAITKLRMTHGPNPSADLTSDQVNVQNFVINNFSASGSAAVRLNLTLGSVNPTGSKTYEAQNSWTASAVIRKK